VGTKYPVAVIAYQVLVIVCPLLVIASQALVRSYLVLVGASPVVVKNSKINFRSLCQSVHQSAKCHSAIDTLCTSKRPII
jgi:hypothetical protein